MLNRKFGRHPNSKITHTNTITHTYIHVFPSKSMIFPRSLKWVHFRLTNAKIRRRQRLAKYLWEQNTMFIAYIHRLLGNKRISWVPAWKSSDMCIWSLFAFGNVAFSGHCSDNLTNKNCRFEISKSVLIKRYAMITYSQYLIIWAPIRISQRVQMMRDEDQKQATPIFY